MLTLLKAQKMIASAIKKADELGIKIVVSVVDAAGNLKAFARMDGASSGSVQISQLKAGTSARLPLSTRQLMVRNADMPGHPYGGGAIPGIILLPGGFPLFDTDGVHVGGIGVSGATPERDEECCQAALSLP